MAESSKFEIESKTVAEFNKLNNAGDLDLSPEYQRKFVWPLQARVSLMETILLGFPIPEIYLAVETSAFGDERVSVVDGQQRLTSLLNFVNGDFPLEGLENERLKDRYEGMYFSDLDEETRKAFFTYRFPVRRLTNVTEKYVREVFARVNRVNMVLSEQEVRNAMLPGPFNEFLKDCVSHEMTIASGAFSAQRMLRGGDLEFYAEVFATCMFGISNKKKELESRYNNLSSSFEDYASAADEFLSLLDCLAVLIKWEGRTRWSNIVDLFTLLHVCWEARAEIEDLMKLGVESEEASAFRSFMDDVQKLISLSRRALGEDPEEGQVDAEREMLNNSMGRLLGKNPDIPSQLAGEYAWGIRNSSDLGSRRTRKVALANLLNLFLDRALSN